MINFRSIAMIALFVPLHVQADELHVMASSALKPFFEKISPRFERETNTTLSFSWGPSFGSSADALPNRLDKGERADIVIMVRESIEHQANTGHLVQASIEALATSRIGLAVKPGHSLPDISTIDALTHTLLTEKSIAISNGISGIHIEQHLFPQLGIAQETRSKIVLANAPVMVGHLLLSGEADIGLQQMSELLAVKGINIVGELPDAVQRVNSIAAAITSNSQQSGQANQLIHYLKAPENRDAWIAAGFTPENDH